MKTVPLNCNHCGAPLRVSETARFATCAHCHAQLAIHHEGAAVFTEVLGEIAERTQSIEAEVRALRVERDLERLDKEWEKERREILGGARTPPKRHDTLLLGGLVFCFGTAALIYGLARGRESVAFGLLTIGTSVLMVLFGLGNKSLYEEAEARYSARRRGIQERGQGAAAPGKVQAR